MSGKIEHIFLPCVCPPATCLGWPLFWLVKQLPLLFWLVNRPVSVVMPPFWPVILVVMPPSSHSLQAQTSAKKFFKKFL